MGRVMLIGLDKREGKQLSSYFSTVGVKCELIPTFDTAIERVPTDPPTLIIANNPDRLEIFQGLQAILKSSAPSTATVVVLPEEKAALAMDVMAAGAYDCLTKPMNRFHVLAAAKRATQANGRTLFGAKVKENRLPMGRMIFFALVGATIANGIIGCWNGPPAATLDLASATLSGIEWQDRALWVGNWYDSTVTHYDLRKGLTTKGRSLQSEEIFKMQDSQPILVCNTPDALITIGFDLKLRAHQRAVGLPTLQTVSAPGSQPTGLAWDGENIWSTDSQTSLLYKHGADLKVLDSMKSLVPNPIGIAWDNNGFWILGGTPLRVARLEKHGASYIWKGPYPLKNFLPPDVAPTGMAIGFDRLWVVSGGTPHMTSRSLTQIKSQLDGWK